MTRRFLPAPAPRSSRTTTGSLRGLNRPTGLQVEIRSSNMRIFNIVYSLVFGRLPNRRRTRIARRDVVAWYRPLPLPSPSSNKGQQK
jgi:hypothetical protein